MPRKVIKKYISELLDIEKDIMPYGITAIWSGVGSGKNGFIEGIHKDITREDGTIERIDFCGLAEKYRVLLITSRKAKVRETEKRHEKDIDSYLTDVRLIDDINFDEYENKSVVCTSAHIKKRIENDYSPFEYACTPFWKKFDFIVIDEFHSLISDATFSDTAFIMKCFLDKVYADCIEGRDIRDIKTRMIFMSGTPHTSKALIKDYPYKEHDLFSKAKFVKPKRLHFVYYKLALRDIISTLRAGGTVVYYMCLFNKLQELIDEAKAAGIDEMQIAVSVSDDDVIKEIKEKYPKTIYQNIVAMERALSEDMTIPDHIKLFITNNKNKEGININTVPSLLAIEHNYMDDIIQICGRFRNGIDVAKIIYDAKQFYLPTAYEREEEYQREQGVVAANNYLEKLIKEHDVDLSIFSVLHVRELKVFIDYIHKLTPYVRCNPFTGQFEMNECYIQARNDYCSSLARFNRLMEEYDKGTIASLSGFFFDGIRPAYYSSMELICIIKRYFKLNRWELNKTIFTEKHTSRLLSDLQKLYDEHPKTKKCTYKNLGNLLRQFGCQKVQYGKAENKKYRICVVDQ